MSDGDSMDNLKQGSDDIVNGFQQLTGGTKQVTLSIASWFDAHPILKWVIITPISALIGNFAIRLLSASHAYFYGATVPINRDVKLEAFPLPVGFSLWLLTFAFVLLTISMYFRTVTLRQRIEELEKKRS